MNGFLLDTNVPSETVLPKPEPKVLAWIDAQRLDTLFLSAVSFGEFIKGIELQPPSKRRTELETWVALDVERLFFGRILPVTRNIAARWGVLTAARRRLGNPLNVPDGLIAATALEHNLTLVTRNVKDFQDLGLTILNPWETA